MRTLVHNLTGQVRRARVGMTVEGRRVVLPTQPIAPGERKEIVGRFTIARPRQWDIGRGELYRLDVDADEERFTPARYRTYFGVRDLRKTAQGQVLLNGRPLKLRGVSLHEDSPVVGSAWRGPQRAALLRWIDDLGANVVRAHYPLHPALMEALDRRGIMVWVQAPVNQVQNDQMAKASVRRNALAANAATVLRDRGHPSVLAFSIANELPVPISGPRSTTRARRPPRCASWTRRGWWRSTGWRATTRPTTATRCSAWSTRSAPTSTSAGTAARSRRTRPRAPTTWPATWTRCTASSRTRPCS